ncbi:MAG: O-antigen ligase family protein, partial [Planctomycetota bacterium]
MTEPVAAPQESGARANAWVGGAPGWVLLIWPWCWTPWLTFYPSALRDAVLPILAAAILVGVALRGRGAAWRARWREVGRTGRWAALAVLALGGWSLAGIWFAPEALRPEARMGFVRFAQEAMVLLAALLACAEPGRQRGLLRALALSGALVGVGCIAAHVGGLSLAYYSTGRMMFPFGMPAALGAFAMASTLAAGALLHDAAKQRSRHAAAAGVAFVLCLAPVVLAATLSAQVGVAAGLWMLGLVYAGQRRGVYLGGSLVLVAVAVAGLAWFLQTPEGRTWQYASSWGARPLYVRTALQAAADRPLAGWGPGLYFYAAGMTEDTATYLHGQRGGWTYAAHCEPLQPFVEGGLPGGMLWLAIWALAAAAAWRGWRRTNGGVFRVAALGVPGAALLVLAGLWADGCFSPAYQQEDIAAFRALLLGFALATGSRRAETAAGAATDALAVRVVPSGALLRGMTALAAVLLAVAALIGVAGQAVLADGALKLKDDQFAVAETAARRALALAQDVDLWQRALGVHATAVRRGGGAAALRAERVRLARELERFPFLPSLAIWGLQVESRIAALVPEETPESRARKLGLVLRTLRHRPEQYRFRIILRDLLEALSPAELERLRAGGIPLGEGRLDGWSAADGAALEALWIGQAGRPAEAALLLAEAETSGRVSFLDVRTERARFLVLAGVPT